VENRGRVGVVKVITAVVRPALFDQLKEALALFGVRRMTVTQVYHAGDGAEGRAETYHGRRVNRDFEPSLRMELLVEDGEVIDLARVIDRVSDGFLWISDARTL
jgi:nitrogen regulatory protein P-II 1